MKKKELIILNGTLGIGKTTTAKSLAKLIHGSLVLHGDKYSKQVSGFSVSNQSKINEAIELMAQDILSLGGKGFDTLIVEYVFERPEHLGWLTEKIDSQYNSQVFYLFVAESEIAKRIEKRSREVRDWELKRFKQILDKQKPYIESGEIGLPVDASVEANLMAQKLLDWREKNN